ncbi:hypothetical protein JAAARDRAFT_187306 [Jaapia argillacea MUCL 33604]|uniref:Uncharacterized protein n=1 Tax=Jaapia argillacea MUCL 33604 TaxID=933084 RepID=A0A067QMP6_9AGAM|nr:hypothetical protein JAAARDRAFT_187306 [Jaapia argillacea MUCL 33604]
MYDLDREREEALLHHVERLLGVHLERRVKVTTAKDPNKDLEADALAREYLTNRDFREKDVYVYVEVNNDLGIGGDSGLQGSLTLLEHISQDQADTKCLVLSYIVISIAGPYVWFSGTVLVDVFIVQPFTEHIYLGGDPFMNE